MKWKEGKKVIQILEEKNIQQYKESCDEMKAQQKRKSN